LLLVGDFLELLDSLNVFLNILTAISGQFKLQFIISLDIPQILQSIHFLNNFPHRIFIICVYSIEFKIFLSVLARILIHGIRVVLL